MLHSLTLKACIWRQGREILVRCCLGAARLAPGASAGGQNANQLHTELAASGVLAVQADVLVCARGGGGLLRSRMQLVAELWKEGICAEVLPARAPHVTVAGEPVWARV